MLEDLHLLSDAYFCSLYIIWYVNSNDAKTLDMYTIENIFLVRVFRERICNLKYCKTKSSAIISINQNDTRELTSIT